MTTQAHIDQLFDKHATIEAELEAEEHRPQPDSLLIADLKRKKLRIKDEIEKLCHTH